MANESSRGTKWLPPQKIVGKVAKCPTGRRLFAGQRRGACWWRTEGFGMGLLPKPALKALQLDELAGLGGLLDSVEKRERLDVIGGGHDGRDLAADNLHKVLELHLVR